MSKAAATYRHRLGCLHSNNTTYKSSVRVPPGGAASCSRLKTKRNQLQKHARCGAEQRLALQGRNALPAKQLLTIWAGCTLRAACSHMLGDLQEVKQYWKTSKCTSKLHMLWWTRAYRDWHRSWHLNWGWDLLDRLRAKQQHKQGHLNCTCPEASQTGRWPCTHGKYAG
jgi:hypothetical protein